MRKTAILFTAFMCLCMLLPLHITAEEAAGNSITLNYIAESENIALSGATFRIYYAGASDGEGGYTLSGAFADYQVDMTELDWNEAGRLSNLAVTLSAYVSRDKITPLGSGTTDAGGQLTFDGLADGLYLIQGDALSVEVDGVVWSYMPQPLLLPMPYPGEDGTDLSEMDIDVKYDRLPPTDDNQLVELSVMKVWRVEGDHPESITAQLLCNGVVTESVVLSEENNWRHVWSDLNAGYLWQITEAEVPEGYTVSVHQEGYVFTITNRGRGDSSSGDTVTTTEQQTTTTAANSTANTTTKQTTTAPSGGSSNGGGTNHNGSSGSTVTKLPQTGQLWWPVPILLGSGVLLFGFGLILRGDDRREEDGK